MSTANIRSRSTKYPAVLFVNLLDFLLPIYLPFFLPAEGP